MLLQTKQQHLQQLMQKLYVPAATLSIANNGKVLQHLKSGLKRTNN